MLTAKTELFENADSITVELATTQVMCACSNVCLNVSDEEADGETI